MVTFTIGGITVSNCWYDPCGGAWICDEETICWAFATGALGVVGMICGFVSLLKFSEYLSKPSVKTRNGLYWA